MEKRPTELPKRSAGLRRTRPPTKENGGGKIRVLLADDHKTLRLTLARFLSRQPDIQIVGQAGDGITAVKLAGERQPDVIVMDLSMPDMHGIEATRLIRTRSPGTRVIGFSAYAAPEHSKAMHKAGAIRYLSKRDTPATLVAAIRASAAHSRKRPAGKRVVLPAGASR